MATVTVKDDKCKGCGLCESACPKKIITLSEEKINVNGFHPATVINQELCIGCAFCATMCPNVAITVEK